jgi:CheY-like chemotaxis protein
MGRECMKTILLVDDDNALREMYEKMLSRAGHTVIASPDGGSALAVVRSGAKVDLVITDRKMPFMDGFELIANLKRMDPAIPVIMVSAVVNEEACSKALEFGAIACIEKPKTLLEMYRILTAVFHLPLKKINCWEFMQCGREPGGVKSVGSPVCPAAVDAALDGVHGGRNSGRACWTVAGTLYAGEVEGSNAKRICNCGTCDFFLNVKMEEEAGPLGFALTRTDMERMLVKMKSATRDQPSSDKADPTHYVQ